MHDMAANRPWPVTQDMARARANILKQRMQSLHQGHPDRDKHRAELEALYAFYPEIKPE